MTSETRPAPSAQPAHAEQIASQEESARRYRTLPREKYDLIVIGGGSAGLPAVQLARALGAQVALLDRERLGGECLYTGCVPSKALLHIARVAASIRTAERLGLSASLAPVNLGTVADRVAERISEVYIEADAPEHYLALGADVAFGEVRFVGPDALTINGQRVRARHFLICTGSHPTIPPVPGLAEAGYLTNENIFDLRQLPNSLVVIGGGPIGCELGQAFARLGARVTILQRAARLLPKDEPAASALLARALRADGVEVRLSTVAERVDVREGRTVVLARATDAAEGGATVEISADAILVATGRTPTTDGLGLDAAGVRMDAGGIGVDNRLRTSNPRIYAAGDVTGAPYFTHAAAKEALAATRNALLPGFAGTTLDTRVLPWATFTEPEVAHVGLTEADARAQHGDNVQVATQPWTGVDRAITDHATEGFTTLIADKDGKLLGAEVVGTNAGELINELALALEKRTTLAQLSGTTHVYPTLGLSIQTAAGDVALARTAKSALVGLLRRLAR